MRTLVKVLLSAVFIAGSALSAPGATSRPELASMNQWASTNMKVERSGDNVRLSVTVLYSVCRIASPPVAVKAGDLYTFSSTVETVLKPFSGTYVTWVELEFRDASEKVIETVRSTELSGAQSSQLLAVTAEAPKAAASVRVAVAAQNKFGILMPAAVIAGSPSLTAAAGADRRGPLSVQQLSPLPKDTQARAAKLRIVAPWPDGISVSLKSDRGSIVPSVILRNGMAEAELHYPENLGGSAEVTAQILNQSATLRIADPATGTLQIDSFQRDGHATDALVQLVSNGRMLPARYSQAGGLYVHPPAALELLPGTWKLRVLQGPQFLPSEKEFEIQSGETVRASTIEIRRGVDLRASGWYAGDPDGDVYHGESIFTDVGAETAATAARAVGMDWVTPANWRKPSPATWAEARAVMKNLSGPGLLFGWADEKKWLTGHFCFVGLHRPDIEPFPEFWQRVRGLQQYQGLVAIRKSGAATFLNHPVRYWVTDGKFTTNMYSGIAFDVVAARLLDGLHLTEGGDRVLQLWSLLLDHGYKIAATGGADFAFDHPRAGQPGTARLYALCPSGLTAKCLPEAIRKGNTVASTGPMLTAVADEAAPPGSTLDAGSTHRIGVKAWARYDRDDRIQRVELWAHGKAISSVEPSANSTQSFEHTFQWKPQGPWDWCAVRVLTKEGWAMSNAFFAASKDWREPKPVVSRIHLKLPEGNSAFADAQLQIWDNAPEAPDAQIVRTLSVAQAASSPFDVPVTASLRIIRKDGRIHDYTVWESSGVRALSETIAKGDRLDSPLLEWQTYEQVLAMCRNVTIRLNEAEPVSETRK